MKKKASLLSRLTQQIPTIYLLLFFFLTIASLPLNAITIFVKHDAGGTNDGTSWTDAYTDLQSALAVAVGGDEIWVAAGTYFPTSGTDRAISFVPVNDVALYGGFDGMETLLGQRDFTNNITILSGDIGTPANSTDNTNHVISITSSQGNTTLIDGFTIEDGNADTNHGGGIEITSSSPSISNCIIQNCAGRNGGGVRVNSGNPTFSSCTFQANTATDGAGATFQNQASVIEVSNCQFLNNISADRAGGLENRSILTLSGTTFSGNQSARFGAAMRNNASSQAIITGCSFISNTSIAQGGAMLNFNSGNIEIRQCIFRGNTGSIGSGIFNQETTLNVVNTVFTGNQSTNTAVINQTVAGSSTYSNCSFSGNIGGAFSNANSSPITIVNSIIWGNSSSNATGTGITQIDYSIVEGGFSGTGNLDADPQFMSPPPIGLGTMGDLRLSFASAAFNTGDNASVPAGVTTDLDGLIRIAFGTVDMGAYESQVHLPVELVYFSAKAKTNTVDLQWQTATEQNNRGFEIQRSSDGMNWSPIGFVAGKGNATRSQDYQYQDFDFKTGINYYRFRQIDFDEKVEFSPIVSVRIDKEEKGFLVFPNPSNGLFTVQMKAQPQEEYLIRLLDTQGRVLRNILLDANQKEIQVSDLVKGQYLLQVISDQERYTEKVWIR